MKRQTGLLLKRIAPVVVVACVLTALGALPSLAADFAHRVTNIGDRSFTISWTTGTLQSGRIRYGTSPEELNASAQDDRGGSAASITHHVTVTGLLPSTRYFYEVLSDDAILNDGGRPFETTTGPELAFAMPAIVSGRAHLANGTTPAGWAIVYVRAGSSQPLSALADEGGTWGLDVARLRQADLAAHYTLDEGDDLTVEVVAGEAEATATITAAEGRAASGPGIAPDAAASLMSSGAPQTAPRIRPAGPPASAQPESASPVNWWLVGGALSGVLLLVLATRYVMRHRFD